MRNTHRLAVSSTWSQSCNASCSLIFSMRAGVKLWKVTIVWLIISRHAPKLRFISISLALPKNRSGSGASPPLQISWSALRFHISLIWCSVNQIGIEFSVSIGHVNEYPNPTMYYFGNPRHTQSMTAYMILTEHFWKFQWKIALWECY